MRIAYLLEDTELAGGIRVAVAHADVASAGEVSPKAVAKRWRSSSPRAATTPCW